MSCDTKWKSRNNDKLTNSGNTICVIYNRTVSIDSAATRQDAMIYRRMVVP